MKYNMKKFSEMTFAGKVLSILIQIASIFTFPIDFIIGCHYAWQNEGVIDYETMAIDLGKILPLQYASNLVYTKFRK